MSMTQPELRRFVRWFEANANSLQQLGATGAADTVHTELSRWAPGVLVEVSSPPCELVLSVDGEPSLMETVAELAAALQHVPGWTVHSLKPPRGFDFITEAGGVSFNASDLKFDPLTSASAPGELGIRLFVPAGCDVDVVHARRVIEHGIGERRAARITYLEVAEMPSDAEDLLAIHELDAYISWHFQRLAGGVVEQV